MDTYQGRRPTISGSTKVFGLPYGLGAVAALRFRLMMIAKLAAAPHVRVSHSTGAKSAPLRARRRYESRRRLIATP